MIALGFGSGLAPKAPGTIGSLWGWASWLLIQQHLAMPAQAILIFTGLLLGWWACTVTAHHMGVSDPGSIVWDEVVAICFLHTSDHRTLEVFLNQFVTQHLAERLIQLRWMLSTAESCTGGMIASRCTDLAGSSAWFERGFVTYSNLSKSNMLGVPEEMIAHHGAVSEPVAKAMALGASLLLSRVLPDQAAEAQKSLSVRFGWRGALTGVCTLSFGNFLETVGKSGSPPQNAP
eukprot:gene25616-32089_t